MAGIKLGKLADRLPVKLTIRVAPDLKRALDDYARVYEQVHGSAEPIGELIPAMLATFLASDHAFAKARAVLAERARQSER
ncbi:MAG: DUF2274 domain-containing protein [Sphingomonadaceae bacterium]|nr:DUF2274 domain-containing protein [Sphingomonadaceae bacterium]